MATIFRSNIATPFAMETSLQHIKKVLFIAGEYGGKAFGDFVYNTIVPRTVNPSCKIFFGIVSLWFTTEDNARLFIENMLSKGGSNYDFKRLASSALPDIIMRIYGVS